MPSSIAALFSAIRSLYLAGMDFCSPFSTFSILTTGFIFRYPQSKIDITGYKYEPWHFRYVGDIAEDVYKSGVTYDEYFEKYIKER